MSHEIKHPGIVESVEGDCVHVRIVQSSACSACKVASYCNSAESKEKIIDVQTPSASHYSAGQPVVVSTSDSMAAKALLWGFGLPCMLMLAVLVAFLAFGQSEQMSAVAAILSLAVYYLLLRLVRGKIARQLTFSIEEVQ